MSKKQLFEGLIILIILSFICMFIYDKFKDTKEMLTTKLVEEKGESKLTLYYTDSLGRNYYLYGLNKIMVDYTDHTLELNKALEARQITLNNVIDLIKEKEEIYPDGTTKISNQNISLIMCNNSDNNDYYFGPSDMEKKEGFCTNDAYICSFTRTYLVRDISESNSEEYTYLTLKAFQGEEVVTVKVEKSLTTEVEEENYYEFKFASYGKSNLEDIESLFDNNNLLSITKTEKIGLYQINESICN